MGHGTRQRTWTEIEQRIVSGKLAGGTSIDEPALAGDLGVEVPVLREALCRLERDGFVRPAEDGSFTVAQPSEIELRESYPVAILLEGLAVRSTSSFPPSAIERLRAINASMAVATDDSIAAATRDWEFHTELVRYCGNEQLLGTLRPLKRLLLRYECGYMGGADFVERSVQQHEEIVQALERGDTEGAARLVENNFRAALPDMLDQL